MPHQDVNRNAASSATTRMLEKMLSGSIVKQAKFRNDCLWTSRQFINAAVLWALSEHGTLTERFHEAKRQSCRLFPDENKCGGSYQAFRKMLCTWTSPLVAASMRWCHKTMLKHSKDDRWVVLGVDGTRLSVPYSEANERSLSAHRGARKNDAPNVWLTMMWNVSAGLPWQWCVGPSNSSERQHLTRLVDDLPERTLLTADAGFAGYKCWRQIIEAGHHFLIRVGSNTRLLKDCRRAPANRVWLWPDKQAKSGEPPIELRLVVLRETKTPVYLVTSVLSSSVLPDEHVGEIYRQRWGVEVFFRDFKRTLNKHKLQSRTPEHVVTELNWSIVGLTLLMLHAKEQQRSSGESSSRSSVSRCLNIFRRAIRTWYETFAQIAAQFRVAFTDSYQRKRKQRRRPAQKRKKKPPGMPDFLLTPQWMKDSAAETPPIKLSSYG